MSIFVNPDKFVHGLRYRLDREGELAETADKADLSFNAPFPIPNDVLECPSAVKSCHRLAVRLFSSNDYLDGRWIGTHTSTMLNFDMGAPLVSGSAFMPVDDWILDKHFTSPSLMAFLTDLEVKNYITLEMVGPAVLRGWIGVPYYGLYALLAGYGDNKIAGIFEGDTGWKKEFCCASLVSRYPFPHDSVSDPVSFQVPPHFWPLVRHQNRMCRTESTLLGVATATTKHSISEAGQRLSQVIRDLHLPMLQARTDVHRSVLPVVSFAVKKGELQPSLIL